MAISELPGDRETTDPGKSANARRQLGSNIGLRRQYGSSAKDSMSTQLSRLESTTEVSSQQALVPSSRAQLRRQAHPSNQPTQLRLRGSKRKDITQLKDDGRIPYADEEPDNARNESLFSPTSRRWTSWETSKSCEDIATRAIIINPDPNLLPVVKTDQARASFDFYINSYVISITEIPPQDISKYADVVHQILHDELLFTAFTTCSEAAKWRTQSLWDDPPLNVVKGYGKTISLLSQRLRSDRFAMSPAALLTMGQLTAIEALIKNVSATARHLAGMQSVIRAKKGPDSSRDPSPVSVSIDIWSQYFMHRLAVRSQIQRETLLTYPRHPFDPELSIQVSELPVGFSDIALSGRCSTEILGLIQTFEGFFRNINLMVSKGIIDSPERIQIILVQAAYCIEYAQLRHLSVIERLIVAALTAYVVRKDRVHPAFVNVRNYFQITCGFLVNLLDKPDIDLHPTDQGSHLVTWIGLVLLLTSSPDANARKLALKLLPRRPDPVRTLQKCQGFFWDEDLTFALLSGSIIGTIRSNDLIADSLQLTMSDTIGPDTVREDNTMLDTETTLLKSNYPLKSYGEA